MRNLFFVLAMFAVPVFSGPYNIKVSKIAFTNNTVAKADTVAANDSVWCVIDQTIDSRLANIITVMLPNVMTSSDSLLVYVEPILGDHVGPDFVNASGRYDTRKRTGEQKDAPLSAGPDYVGKSFKVGGYYDDAGAFRASWSPKDSCQTYRAKIVLVESTVSSTATKITGCDSLATSSAYISWVTEGEE